MDLRSSCNSYILKQKTFLEADVAFVWDFMDAILHRDNQQAQQSMQLADSLTVRQVSRMRTFVRCTTKFVNFCELYYNSNTQYSNGTTSSHSKPSPISGRNQTCEMPFSIIDTIPYILTKNQ